MNKKIVFLTLVFGVVLFSGLSGSVSANQWQETQYGDDVTDYDKDDILDIMDRDVSELSNSEIDIVIHWVEYNGYDSLSDSELDQYDIWLPQAMLQFDYSDEEIDNNESLFDTIDILSSDSESEEEEEEEEEQEQAVFSIEDNLQIVQQSYVDTSVEQTVEEDRLIYQVSGGQVRLHFSDEVTIQDFNVIEDARFFYDSRDDSYVLEPENDGTYILNFTLEYRDTVYNESISLDFTGANFVHLSASEHDDLQSDAQSWRSVETTWSDYYDSRDELENILNNDAFLWYQFIQDPLEAYTSNFVGLVMLFTSTPAGMSVLSILALLTIVFRYRDKKDAQKSRRQMDSIGDIDMEMLEQEARKLRKLFSEKDYQDLGFTDEDSRFFREHLGNNPKSAVDTLSELISDRSIIEMYVDAYIQQGYELVKNEDGDYEIVEETRDGDAVIDSYNIDDDIVKCLSLESFDRDIIHKAEDLELPLSRDNNDITDDLGISLREDGDTYAYVDNREELSKMLADLLTKIASMDEFDEEGRLRAEYDLINVLWQYTAESSEKYRLPLWMLRDVMIKTQKEMDAEKSLQSDIKYNDNYGVINDD